MDLLKLIQKLPSAPGFLNEAVLDKFGARATIPDVTFPKAFATKRPDAANGRSLPQVIAHRGYKAKHPENTIRAFEAAVEAGAHALETDLHLTKDGVVVLSHDLDLKRCFGVEGKIGDFTWGFLKTLRTSRAPNESMACLRDLLERLRRPEWRGIWLLLDVKFSDDPRELVYHIKETFGQVDPGDSAPWKAKVMLGYWTAEYIPLYHEYFPGFPIANIGFSIPYSRQFLAVPDSTFNVMQASLVSFHGRRFIRDVQAKHRQIISWTVNDEKNIDWCIRRGVDGVITDDVPKVLGMCEMYGEERRYHWSMRMLLGLIRLNIWIYLFGVVFRRRYGTCIIRCDEVHKSGRAKHD